MKNSIVVLSVAVTLLCCFLLFEKNREVEAARARAAAAEQKREALASEAAQAQQRNKNLRSQLRETATEASDHAAATQALQQRLARAQAEAQAAAQQHKGVSEIFLDQAMREVFTAEARQGVSKGVNALFKSGLAQQLQLSDSQTEALKPLLTQKGTLLWEQFLVPMITGEVDDSNMASTGNAVRQGLAQNAAQIRALLGDQGYDTYQWFEKTQPERDRLTEFDPQFVKAGQPLSPDQQNQLLALMTDEHANFKFSYDISDPTQLDFEHWYDNFTEDRINTFSSEVDQLNDRILQRAQSVLSPDQLALFKQLITEQSQRAQFTMRMTTAMLPNRSTARTGQ